MANPADWLPKRATRLKKERATQFDWVIPKRLIATHMPGPTGLRELRSQGIDTVISLTIGSPDERVIKASGLKHHHFPLADMSAPDMGFIERFVGILQHELDQGRKVAVHCGAGLGRTGTLLACYFVNEGFSADEAIKCVRRARPGSVESHAQEQAVERYDEYLSEMRSE